MELEAVRRQVAEYAMALDLLAGITQSDTAELAIDNIVDLFATLFAPGKLTFIPQLVEGCPPPACSTLSSGDGSTIKNLIADAARKYAWTAAGNGFIIKISYKGNLLGLMVVDELAFPEQKENYLNLSLSLADVCGLAIENARRHQLLTDSRNRLRAEKEKAEIALAKVKQLSGLLPICSHCKKIRDDQGYWKQIELYILEHSEAAFSHSICIDCARLLYPDLKLYDE